MTYPGKVTFVEKMPVPPQEVRISLSGGPAIMNIPSNLTWRDYQRLQRALEIFEPEPENGDLPAPPQETIDWLTKEFEKRTETTGSLVGVPGPVTATEAFMTANEAANRAITKNKPKTPILVWDNKSIHGRKDLSVAAKCFLAAELREMTFPDGTELHRRLEAEFGQRVPIHRIYKWMAEVKAQARKEETETAKPSRVCPDKMSMAIISVATGIPTSDLFPRAYAEDWPFDKDGETELMNAYVVDELPEDIRNQVIAHFKG